MASTSHAVHINFLKIFKNYFCFLKRSLFQLEIRLLWFLEANIH